MLDGSRMDMLKQIAAGLSAQFGPNCETVIHDLGGENGECAIAHIENGHVTGRKTGDGPSKIVAEHLFRSGGENGESGEPKDQLAYLTRTPDGKILKSSTLYIRDGQGEIGAILSINYDISALLMIENALSGLLRTADAAPAQAERISVLNVNDLLDDLIEQSTALTGKPVALMTKDDKVRAIQFLSRHGAFLITKSGDKVARHFGISKYTLYSYIDTKQQEEKRHEQD